MRKILMFGTMLGVASAALAFGGMFNHGSKSTTYKGGVDAIGVHFGGEKKTDSQPEEICAEGVLKDRFGHCNICENGNVYLSYMDDPCGTEIEMEGDCVSNADCESVEGCENNGCYCALSNDEKNCIQPNTGTCLPLDEGKTYAYKGTEFLGSTKKIIWWEAENWCKAHGKQMVSFSDLGIDTTQLGEGFNNRHYCVREDCENLDWSSLENAFSELGGSWVNDAFNSCESFRMVVAYSPAIWKGRREGSRGDFYSPLCK